MRWRCRQTVFKGLVISKTRCFISMRSNVSQHEFSPSTLVSDGNAPPPLGRRLLVARLGMSGGEQGVKVVQGALEGYAGHDDGGGEPTRRS